MRLPCGSLPRNDATVTHFLRDSHGRPVDLEIEVHTARSPQELPPCPWQFPDPRGTDERGFIGFGADFAPATIVAAYRGGIFPWPHSEAEFAWFSPDPRAVIPLQGLRISQRLGRTLRSGRFRYTVDAAFGRVMRSCAAGRPEGTWITDALVEGYCQLHALGWAHSVEVWSANGRLAGGLYGVAVGSMFGAESMFHRQTDASKAAMAALVQHAASIGVELLDVQVLTEHTERMGAVEIPRAEYLRRLEEAAGRRVDWTDGVSG
ncbi:MAG: leucyl/phenylalanyl-tRNA--protein transferase [Dehalococcoidia bacterium]|jgi:leucyl/phenylalanyl-tRNA--protein transferase